jgi:hypothetical protein
LDAGLLIGETPPPPPPTATVVAVARDAVTCAAIATRQFSVPAISLDVKLAFGEAAVLARHTGEAVPVDESGVTVEPLQQDTLYYVLMVCDNLYIASDHEVILLSVQYRKRRKSS